MVYPTDASAFIGFHGSRRMQELEEEIVEEQEEGEEGGM